MERKTASTSKSARPRSVGKHEHNEITSHPKLEKLFTDSLKDIYWAEKNLIKSLTKLEKQATTEKLKEAFREHRTQTEQHVDRVEQAFEILGQKPAAKKCEAMEGLIKETDSLIEETEGETYTRDVALIMAAQKVEHYEIASYGTLVQVAKILQQDNVVKLLSRTLEEEKEADALLTQIAEGGINATALDE